MLFVAAHAAAAAAFENLLFFSSVTLVTIPLMMFRGGWWLFAVCGWMLLPPAHGHVRGRSLHKAAVAA